MILPLDYLFWIVKIQSIKSSLFGVGGEPMLEGMRRDTRTVWVGSVGVGSSYPVRIQSMTTSDTRDVAATVEQIVRLADGGCEIARVTVQGMKEAHACEQIKSRLLQKGYQIPLVADIHFYPPAALTVVEFVDKVRINPGNFADPRATLKVVEYDQARFEAGRARMEEKLAPLVEKCKQLKRSMRIGTNHGSLSDRMLNWFGDTPKGMVESALECTHICRKYGYHDIIYSMKSSNPRVMVAAYRLLVEEMERLGWDYPLHLGVTEAGAGQEGRVKSAMGIGALLMDGIGDTIRVSLTEDCWEEIDPCRRIVAQANRSWEETHVPSMVRLEARQVPESTLLPLHRDGSVALQVTPEELASPDLLEWLGARRGRKTAAMADLLIVNGEAEPNDRLTRLGIGLVSPRTLGDAAGAAALVVADQDDWSRLRELSPVPILFQARANALLYQGRRFAAWMGQQGLRWPILWCESGEGLWDDVVIRAGMQSGALLCDGLGDGVCIQGSHPLNERRQLALNLLQAARMRASSTEFISCPSCGRTLFNLQEVAARIRSRTAHLPGVKIAIMGCIVNGPGEMADADFGYVGSQPGKIDLYVGRDCVERGIDAAQADDRLIALIKSHGRWQEPESV
jgi:(E)-4-hydroxy-3-methylbut-2-enyl-diphosphate synthase